MSADSTKSPPASRTILIAGVVRNGQTTLARNIRHLAGAFGGFRKVHWMIVESDSNDQTLDQLALLAREIPNFKYKSLGNLRDGIAQRAARIAHCRNVYLDALSADPDLADVDDVAVADLDDVNLLLTPQAVLSCWQRQDWDACAANQRAFYYDIWALRHPIWSPNDCWKQKEFFLRHGMAEDAAYAAAVFSRMIRLPEDSEWIEVDSAFGGLVIYRKQALLSARYAGLDERGDEICEHITLHQQMRAAGYRIFINPRLINAGYTEHTRRALPAARLKLWFKHHVRYPIKRILGLR